MIGAAVARAAAVVELAGERPLCRGARGIAHRARVRIVVAAGGGSSSSPTWSTPASWPRGPGRGAADVSAALAAAAELVAGHTSRTWR